MSDSNDRDVDIFTECVQLPIDRHAAFLERACGDDFELRERVRGLLEAHTQAGLFLSHAAGEVFPGFERKPIVGEQPGDWIGRYKLLQQIGEGGCGVVFMAEQKEPVQRLVALKIIKPGMDSKSVIARFEVERQALALMDHPNIAKVFDAGATDTGRPYFVMELIHGVKITEYCDQNSLSMEERLKLFAQVCNAVQHAHQKGIIHRDIKPSNILVTVSQQGDAMPVVIDFGIAKAATNQKLTDKTLFTAFEMLIGTPAYMSPEQAAIKSREVDTRSDIYSLGILLYELLTSSTPFDADQLLASGLDEIRRVIREQEFARPSTRLSKMTCVEITQVANRRQSEPPKLIRSVCGDLDWIVMKAVEKDPSRRYETADGLALDVKRFLANEAVSARSPSRRYKLQKVFLRNKLIFTGATLIALLIVLSLIVVSMSLARERQAHLKAKADEAKAENETAKSRQATQFLEKMLQGVGPSVALGRDSMMLKEILDRTAQGLNQDLTNQPEVVAELGSLIGGIYYQLGNYPQSEQMQRSALDIDKKVFGPESPQTAKALNDLGLTFWRTGKQAQAETNDLMALALWRRLEGDEGANVATSLNNLANVYRHYGRDKEAEPLARQALKIRQKIFGPDSLEAADTLRVLSILMGDEGKWAESETLGKEVLEIRRKRLGPNDPSVAASLMDIAWAADAEGNLDEAQSLVDEALVLRQKVLGSDHPDVADSLSHVGQYMERRGELDQAYSMFSSALGIQRRALNEDNPKIFYTLRKLGSVLEAQRKFAEAEKMYREALDSWRKQGDKYPVDLLSELQNEVRTLMELKRFGDARQLLDEVLTPALVQQPASADVLFLRASLEGQQGEWQKAADDASLMFAYQPENNAWYCLEAGLLLKTHNLPGYESLCQQLLKDYASSTNIFVADAIAKACLFVPPSESDLAIIRRLSDLTVTRGTNDEGAMPFFEVCKALAEYRSGNFTEAIKWAQKSTESNRPDAYQHAYAVLALSYWQLGQKQMANVALAKGEALASGILPQVLAEDPGHAWISWLCARITLDEADATIHPVAANGADLNKP